MTDFNALIDAAFAANNQGTDIKGKKYTTVPQRVELFRRHLGASYGIETTVEVVGLAKGEPVMVRAVIRDKDGRIVATGHAQEIVGAGHINAGSALENCETSAIGRALAALGIHGGEFASVQEIEKHQRNMGKVDQPPTSLMDAAADTLSEAEAENPEAVAMAVGQMILDKVTSYKKVEYLDQFWLKVRPELDFISMHSEGLYQTIREKAIEHRNKIKGKAA